MELEANLGEEGADVYGEYTPLAARDILAKDIDELKVGVGRKGRGKQGWGKKGWEEGRKQGRVDEGGQGEARRRVAQA